MSAGFDNTVAVADIGATQRRSSVVVKLFESDEEHPDVELVEV